MRGPEIHGAGDEGQGLRGEQASSGKTRVSILEEGTGALRGAEALGGQAATAAILQGPW